LGVEAESVKRRLSCWYARIGYRLTCVRREAASV